MSVVLPASAPLPPPTRLLSPPAWGGVIAALLATELEDALRGRVLYALGRTYDYQGRWHEAIATFEPRIDAKSLVVTLQMNAKNHHNTLQLTIRGQMWAQPVPLELLLAANVELETGETQLRDMR